MMRLPAEDRVEMLESGVSETLLTLLEAAMARHGVDPNHDVEWLYGAEWAVTGFAYLVRAERVEIVVRRSSTVEGVRHATR